VQPGDIVAVFGAGPVGLLAAHSAYLKGAARVFVADQQPDRLRLAERFGATPVNIAATGASEQIIDATEGWGAGCASTRSATRLTTPRARSILR
jgi:glutathione-independent formaldehyde dehydrogenase